MLNEEWARYVLAHGLATLHPEDTAKIAAAPWTRAAEAPANTWRCGSMKEYVTVKLLSEQVVRLDHLGRSFHVSIPPVKTSAV